MWTIVAYRSAPIDDLIRLLDDFDRGVTGSLLLFAVELVVVWAIPALIVMFLLMKFAPSRYPDEEGPRSALSLKSLAVACVLGLALCWLMNRTDLKGQAIGGVIAGMALAIMIVRLIWPNANGTTLVLAVPVVGVVGHVVGAFFMGDNAMEMVTKGETWALSRPSPLDYVAAGFVGVSLGISLARSFGHEEEPGGETSETVTAPSAGA